MSASPTLPAALPHDAKRSADTPWLTGIAAKDMLTSSSPEAVFLAPGAAGSVPTASNEPLNALRRVPVEPSSPSTRQHPAAPASAREVRLSDAALAARAERNDALATLLHDAAAGSSRAFEAFYDATIGYAHALARRMLRPADVQDVVADAYFQAWREVARFDPARGAAVTWLLTLLRSRALDLLRHQRASPEVESLEDPPEIAAPLPGPDELLAGMQAGTQLHAALAGLSSNERWVLGLAYYRELSHREICAETGLPLGTVKSLILRAQAKLREQLATA
jgi:RNA polymerase sigma-70 factor, ECF subfamily